MTDDQAKEMLEILRDVRVLLQFGAREELRELRERVFNDEENQTTAFRLFCLGNSYREIGGKVGVSHATVARWVDSWRSAGLVHAREQRCLVSPEMLGLG